MVSLETCNNLRDEMKRLLTQGDDLLDEDVSLLGLFEFQKDYNCVLGLAKNLKEEGNYFFKRKMFDDALEKYGYAGLILTQHVFKGEEDRVSFFELALCILLNFTACLSKKKEFMQVGHICSIILEFDSSNVKAMFRRALAALELGRQNWAYWDLSMAMEIEPENKEILKKLEEVKSNFNGVQVSKRPDVTPIGLGLGLSPPKKKFIENLDGDTILKHDEKVNKTPTTTRKDELDISTQVNGMNNNQRHVIVEDKVLQKSSSVNEVKVGLCEYNTEKKEGIEGEVNDLNDASSDQAEPKYRFVNRKRPGSSLSISKNDLQNLMKGKTLFRFNSRQGSSMTIRVVAAPGYEQKKKGEGLEDQKAVELVQNEDDHNKDSQASDQNKEDILMADSACEPKMIQLPLICEKHRSFTLAVDGTSRWNTKYSRWKRKETARGSKTHDRYAKKSPSAKYMRITPLQSNHILCCRYQVGSKRKEPPTAMQYNRPWKHPTLVYSDLYQCNSMSTSKFLNRVSTFASSSETCSSKLVCSSCTIASHDMVSDH